MNNNSCNNTQGTEDLADYARNMLDTVDRVRDGIHTPEDEQFIRSQFPEIDQDQITETLADPQGDPHSILEHLERGAEEILEENPDNSNNNNNNQNDNSDNDSNDGNNGAINAKLNTGSGNSKGLQVNCMVREDQSLTRGLSKMPNDLTPFAFFDKDYILYLLGIGFFSIFSSLDFGLTSLIVPIISFPYFFPIVITIFLFLSFLLAIYFSSYKKR